MKYLVALFSKPLYSALTVACAWAVAYWHGAPEMIRQLAPVALACFAMDTVLGGWVALKHHRFRSSEIGRAFQKFLVYGAAVIMGVIVDHLARAVLSTTLDYYGILAVLGLVAYREGTSALENLALLGCKIPFLSERMEKVCRGLEGAVLEADRPAPEEESE